MKFSPPLLSNATLALTLAFAISACASLPPPTAQVEAASAALSHAAGAGANEFAPLDMKLAGNKLARARNALAAGDNELALSLAQESQADSQLAEARTGALKAEKTARAAMESDRVLREEMARKAN